MTNCVDPDQDATFCYASDLGLHCLLRAVRILRITEPANDKTYKMACAPSEDSDQPGHPPSLNRVFAVHMKTGL